ncbi:uncharacterized protein F5891DRAFT_996942 [Suillus fuscotomentosus]|uniref:CCZ1/INTU/HSP4 first Longin domain-containing protein n=1 Tax=Suillus fuscotomentosus TaxID=1912939 RepID=A0AAD4EKB4_9AGAM|nr:uncharacterized protein F5891DRAFT_996942 [Suillus fuscotomentosus]KAG1907762.1 hypothetical protein F5891DRAFT_996942 [Suillus fuscotomentosus]
MSRLHPALLYLTIYNPTLHPSEEVSKDDEDAEEQAQILFYSSQERATSRDKMLRQVGLAKALINFSEIFHPTDSCHNVHSQSRRMIMLNPEPDFWIHAAVELAKTPRTLLPKPKDKGKGNGKGKGKEKEKASTLQPSYDYHEGSFHDYALRAHLLRGYEQFKLTHGSFTSILNSFGQEALELQLERFFTVWAWSWDLSKNFELNDDLGLSLHPLYPSILPLLDTFSSQLPAGLDALFLSPPHVVPSSGYRQSNYPPALSRHLLSLIPRHLPHHEADGGPEASSPAEKGATANTVAKEVGSGGNPSSGFLGMPSSLAMSMDVRNWSWPGALTFGKGAEPKSPVTEREGMKPNPSVAESVSTVVEVDRGALGDAISSADIHCLLEKANDGSSVTDPDAAREGCSEMDHSGDTPRPSRVPSPLPADDSSTSPPEPEKPDRHRQLDFACTFVFLPESDDPLETRRRQVIHLRCQTLAVALIADADNVEDYDTHVISEATSQMLHDIENLIAAEATRASEILPSATKILQPKDNYLISFDHFTAASPDFVAKSDYLYNGKQLLEQGLHITEVFSRGQQPQHWHVSKRDNTGEEEREVFLEVARKETSLSDVDNILQRLQSYSF